MSTLGIFNTSNQSPGVVKPSFSDTIFRKNPSGSATLLGISSRLKNETLGNINHHWFVKQYTHANFVLAAPAPAVPRGASQPLQVVDASQIIPNMVMVFSPVMEQVLVLGVVGNIVTVRRGIGNVPPIAQPAGTQATLISTAFEESSLRPMGVSDAITELDNQTQIFRNSWAISGSAAAQVLQVKDGNDAMNRQDAGLRHARMIETALLFSERNTQVLNGQPLRYTDGLISMIQKHAPSNYIQSSGDISMDQLDAMLDPLFDVVTDQGNMNDRLMFVDKVAMKIINDLGKMSGIVQITQGQTSFGHQFKEFNTTRGNFKIMEHPLLNYMPGYRGSAIVVDLSSISIPYLRPTFHGYYNNTLGKIDGDQDDNGIDAMGGTYTSELMFKCIAPEANGVILNMRQAVCTPCVPVAAMFKATLSVSHPCDAGEVAPGTTVTLTISGAKPNSVVKVSGVNSILTMTTDANGMATTTQVVGSDESYVFEVQPDATNNSTAFIGGVATVCVEQPCDGPKLVNDPIC